MENSCINSRQAIIGAERRLRAQYTFLNHQNMLGLTIFCTAIACFLLCSLAYYHHIIPAWLCVLLNAFWGAILHEIEHDIFHQQYFRKNKLIQNTMLAIGWLFQPNKLNPWLRRRIHLEHHQHAGGVDDMEERMIGNGMSYGIARLLISLMPVAIVWRLFYLKQVNSILNTQKKQMLFFSLYGIYSMIWLLFIMNTVFNTHIATAIVNFLFVVYALPATLRLFCLINISSTIHYQGGVNSLAKQVQIIDHWLFWPLQIFCINFGATHMIHHIYVPQPFYIRFFIKPDVIDEMKNEGILFNDFGTFKRKNHFPIKTNSLD